MGYYVNPQGMSNDTWLQRHGTFVGNINIRDTVDTIPVPQNENFENHPYSLWFVFLVDNGLFYAAGIAFSVNEFNVFAEHVNDKRPKLIYSVRKHMLDEFLPEDLQCKALYKRVIGPYGV